MQILNGGMVHHKMNRDSENTDVSRKGVLKFIHVISTGWFVLCVSFLIVAGLRQAGVRWWVIFSLSGYSAVLVFLLTSIYLFAVFRGVVRSQKTEIEHPLSSSIHYLVFYDLSPFLGMLAGSACVFDDNGLAQHLNTIAFGSLATTFLVWIVVDPAVGLFEMLLPVSRKHRTQRLAEDRTLRQKRRIENEQLLAELRHTAKLNQQKWSGFIEPMAEKLAELIANFQPVSKHTEGHIVQIGAEAWRLGGITCMRQLHERAVKIYSRQDVAEYFIDHIAIWWDGIGSWREPALSQSLYKIA